MSMIKVLAWLGSADSHFAVCTERDGRASREGRWHVLSFSGFFLFVLGIASL